MKGAKIDHLSHSKDAEFEHLKNFPATLPSLAPLTNETAGIVGLPEPYRSDSHDHIKPTTALLDPLPSEAKLVRQRSDTFEGKPPLLTPLEKMADNTSTPEIRKSKSLTKKLKHLATVRGEGRTDSPAQLERNISDSNTIEKVPLLIRAASNSSPLMKGYGIESAHAAEGKQGYDKESTSFTTNSSALLSLHQPPSAESSSDTGSHTNTPNTTNVKGRDAKALPSTNLMSPVQTHKVIRTATGNISHSSIPHHHIQHQPILPLKPQTPITVIEKKHDLSGDESPPVFQHFSLPKSVINNNSNQNGIASSRSVNNTPKTTHKTLQVQHLPQATPTIPITITSHVEATPIAEITDKFTEATVMNEKTNENDRILQERLQEAKALARKEENGATMFKFSLWSKKPSIPDVHPTKMTENDASEDQKLQKHPSRIRGPKIARETQLQSFSEDNPLNAQNNTILPAMSASISDKDFGNHRTHSSSFSNLFSNHNVSQTPVKHYIEESSRENADLSFLQERSNLDLSNLGSSIHDAEGHLENSYSDDDFVKVGDEEGEVTIFPANNHSTEVSFMSENNSVISGQGNHQQNTASKGLASALRNKVVVAKSMHLKESPVSNKSHQPQRANQFEETTTASNLATESSVNTSSTRKNRSASNSRVLRKLDFSSFTEMEVQDEIEYSYSSFANKPRMKPVKEDIFASISHEVTQVDDDVSSHEENDDASSIAEEEGLIKSALSRSHSFNLDDHTVASSIHTIMSRSGPMTFNSVNMMTSYLEIPDDDEEREDQSTRTRRATSSQIELQGIAYEDSVTMVRSLTSRDQPRDRGHQKKPSNGTNIKLEQDKPKKEEITERLKAKPNPKEKTEVPSSSSSKSNSAARVNGGTEKVAGNEPVLKSCRSSERLSKYQKLKNLRTAKKQKDNPTSVSTSLEPSIVSESIDQHPREQQQTEQRRVPSIGNEREVTDREENNSSPMLSEVSNDEDSVHMMNEENIIPNIPPNPPLTLNSLRNHLSVNPDLNHSQSQSQSQSHSLIDLPMTSPIHQGVMNPNHTPLQNNLTTVQAPSASTNETRTKSPINFIKGEVIGEGTFGKVFKGLNETTGELLAIKQFFLADGSKKEVDELQREINVMWELNHENIVRYRGTTKTDKYLYIILEYVTGGSIANMLTQFGSFSENLIRRFSFQILRGVDYLHDKGIIHRDIKGANILVTDTGVAKLADFGCSKRLAGLCTASLEESMYALKGSVPWMAPEVIKQAGYGRSSDIWSFGATVIEMATGKPPWSEYRDNLAALFHVATSTKPPTLPSQLSSPCAEFITSCMMIDPDKRSTARDLLRQSEFLKTEIIKYGIQNNPLKLADQPTSTTTSRATHSNPTTSTNSSNNGKIHTNASSRAKVSSNSKVARNQSNAVK